MVFISQIAIEEGRAMNLADGEGPLRLNYYGAQLIDAAEAYLQQQSSGNNDPVPALEFFERHDDMGLGKIQFILDGDSDVILTVIDKEGQSCSVEFCTPIIGGGRSPKVREALINVIKAIREENLSSPQHR